MGFIRRFVKDKILKNENIITQIKEENKEKEDIKI